MFGGNGNGFTSDFSGKVPLRSSVLPSMLPCLAFRSATADNRVAVEPQIKMATAIHMTNNFIVPRNFV
jgi:hypothetical protein